MHPAARLGLPVVAAAAGLPALLAGMVVAPAPHVLVGPRDDTVRTMLVDAPPSPLTDDRLGLDGAHPPVDPSAQLLGQTLGGGDSHRDRSRGVPVRVSGTALPARVLLAYRNAAADLRSSDPSCHLSWSLLAGIGQVESGQAYGGAVDRQGRTLVPILGPVLDGTGDVAAIADTDGGHWDGDTTWDRAVGPMQFIPSSWGVWGRDGDGDGSANPSDIDDAALATASYLCAGSRDLANLKDRRQAVFSYNHSWDYVDLVLAYAEAYATGHTVVLGPKFGTRGPAKGSDRGVDGGTVVRIVPGDALAIPPGTPLPPGTVVVPPPGTDSPVVVADPPAAPLVELPPGAAGSGGEVGAVSDTSAQPATSGPAVPAASTGPSADPSSSPSDSPSVSPSSAPQHTPSPDPTTSAPNPDPTTSAPSPSSDPTTSSPSPTCPTSTPTDASATPSPPPSSCPTPDASPSDTGSPAATQTASP